jgi:hypothetical protein
VTPLAIPLHNTTAVAQHGLCATCTNMPGCGLYRVPKPIIRFEESPPASDLGSAQARGRNDPGNLRELRRERALHVPDAGPRHLAVRRVSLRA